jgi:TrmH family RNA methyltransferase
VSRLAAARPALVVILANVRDPGNAGTVLRTADAAGADGVVFAGASVDPYNGKCVRAAAGSLFHLPVVAGAPLDAAISALRGAGLAILAADGGGPARLDDPALAPRLAGPAAWLFGNEAWAARGPPLALADEGAAVPHLRPSGREPRSGLPRPRGLPLRVSGAPPRWSHSEAGRGAADER